MILRAEFHVVSSLLSVSYFDAIANLHYLHWLCISKWTLSWTWCSRIHHSLHLGAKFSFELPLVRVTDPPPADQIVKTPAPSLFALSLDALYSFNFWSSRARLCLLPTGLPALKIYSSGPNSCGDDSGKIECWLLQCLLKLILFYFKIPYYRHAFYY